ncbi:MAG: polysaccharide deacetylase family protein [Bacteroidales bacterium]|nr:polysaccharide deacetylase family protein [Bacteroidales bacterium]
MIIIYAEEVTIRMKYIFSLIFKEFLGHGVEFTTNVEEYYMSEYPAVNYSKKPIRQNEIWIYPHGLLSQLGIKDINLEYAEFQGIKCPFQTFSKESDFPFDPFAAAFFLITRYEEYLPYKKDEYGRFPAHESIAFKKGFLQFPVIDQWVMEIKKRLEEKNPSIHFKENKFTFIPTVDVDVAYAYKLRGLIRTVGGFILSLIQFDLNSVFQRFRVLLGLEKDPYDTFNYLLTLHKKYQVKPLYFILFADYDLNDKNISVLNKRFQHLIKSLGDYAEIGIHPSFNSFEMPGKMRKEIDRLSKTINKEITKSRQHFLRMNLPSTYNYLEDSGIKEDYTMGYARHIGFRASTARPFYFYDLEREMPTYLKIYPFAVMDGTLKDYMKLTPQQSEDTIKALISRVKAVNGVFISLWHNHSLSGQEQWQGWRRVYEFLLRQGTEK